jgi:hypothetical protein
MRHHTNMSGSPDVEQAQFHLNRLSGRPLFQCGGVNGLQLDFGPPGSPQLTIEGPFTITLPDATAVTGCEVLDEFVIVTVPGLLVNQAVDATIAEDRQLTLRFAGGTTLTVPPDDKCEAWQLRDDTGLLIVCMPGGGLAVWSPDQPSAAQAFTLDGPDGLKWIIDPPVEPYADGYIRRSQVEIRTSGLVAQTTATLAGDGLPNLAEFFADLAANWRGWAGERRWRAQQGEMEIEASHDGRRYVLIAVTVRRPQLTLAKDPWSARIVFTLEAGEQLTTVARHLASILAA